MPLCGSNSPHGGEKARQDREKSIGEERREGDKKELLCINSKNKYFTHAHKLPMIIYTLSFFCHIIRTSLVELIGHFVLYHHAQQFHVIANTET